jgi:hypothetical protein
LDAAEPPPEPSLPRRKETANVSHPEDVEPLPEAVVELGKKERAPSPLPQDVDTSPAAGHPSQDAAGLSPEPAPGRRKDPEPVQDISSREPSASPKVSRRRFTDAGIPAASERRPMAAKTQALPSNLTGGLENVISGLRESLRAKERERQREEEVEKQRKLEKQREEELQRRQLEQEKRRQLEERRREAKGVPLPLVESAPPCELPSWCVSPNPEDIEQEVYLTRRTTGGAAKRLLLGKRSWVLFGRRLAPQHADAATAEPDIGLASPRASRKHALLLRNWKGQAFLMDLGSACGTVIDNKKLPAKKFCEWKPGMVVHFADPTAEVFELSLSN